MATLPQQVPPGMENFAIGIIGMGAMGKMYAQRLSDAGWKYATHSFPHCEHSSDS